MHDLKFTQNFLHSKALVENIVRLAKIQHGETVLEIGPGKGIITHALASHVGTNGRVFAVELDNALIPDLRTRFANTPQVEIVHGDILTIKLSALFDNYAVFSNVPFSITSEIVDMLFTQNYTPDHATLILQKETLVSTNVHGEGKTFKSLLIAPQYTVQVIHTFSRSDFTPKPSVDTVLFRFERRATPLVANTHYALYKDFLAFVAKDRVGEGAWRKVFSKRQTKGLQNTSGLTFGRGIKSQSTDGIINAFNIFLRDASKHSLVAGAMNTLRKEQQRRETINRTGKHHRSKKRRS